MRLPKSECHREEGREGRGHSSCLRKDHLTVTCMPGSPLQEPCFEVEQAQVAHEGTS